MTDAQIRRGFEEMGPGEALRKKMLAGLMERADGLRGQAGRKARGVPVRAGAWRRLTAAAGGLAVALVLGAGVWLALGRQLSREPLSYSDMSSSAEMALVTKENEFVWQGRRYFLADGEDALSPETVGEQLGVIRESSGGSLAGCPVYRYLPGGCEALVAVLRGDSYQLFRFASFLSYEENGDEDMSAYLELYGMAGPEALERVEFYVYPDAFTIEKAGELTGSQELARFYGYFSRLTDSSAEYFDALGLGGGAGEASGGARAESGREGGAASPSYEGSGALDGSVKLCLVGTNGMVLEAAYYPRIGFISRHRVSAEFASALAEWTGAPG